MQQIIINRLNNLSADHKRYLVGDDVETIVRTFSEAHAFSSEKSELLGNGFTLLVLLLVTYPQFIEFLKRELALDDHAATLLAHAMTNSLPEELQTAIVQNENAPEAVPETIPTPIPQLRTMAGDGKQIGYQSLAETTYTSTLDTLTSKTE